MTNMWAVQGGQLVAVARSPLDKEERLETWIASRPEILGLDIMLIGRQVSTPHGGRIDLLGMTRGGDLMILELKRNRTPRDIVAQVLDYASWVVTLTTKDVHEIASRFLGEKPLAAAFRERFSAPLPENLNATHGMVVIASEPDESSARIIEYLANTHGLNINTAFFNFFKSGDSEFLTADWLMDQQDVAERSENRKRAPWSGFWYVNVADDADHGWDDARRYGFVAAGGGSKYSRPLLKLEPGSHFFAYLKRQGYVGFGRVLRPAVMARDFEVDGRRLLDLELTRPGIGHDLDDPELAEYVVGVEWLQAVPADDARKFPDAFANQNIVCQLRDAATVDFLLREFPAAQQVDRPV